MQEFYKKVADLWIKTLGGLRAYQEYTFEAMVTTTTNSDVIAAAKNFERSKENIYIFGPVGTGKSHLAIAAARKYLREAQICVLKMPVLSRRIRACQRADEEQEIIDDHRRSGVLIIDDIGSEKDTEFLISILYEIIDGRYMDQIGGLIVTSNLGLDALAVKLGSDRIPSRLAQMCQILSLEGELDYRLKKRGVKNA